MLIAIRLVFDVLPSQLPHLMATKTMETATLLNAPNAGLRAAVDGLRLLCDFVTPDVTPKPLSPLFNVEGVPDN
jgi:hypothetical protein